MSDEAERSEPLGRLHLRSRSTSALSCPYCREALEPNHAVLVCEACQTAYHPDCLRSELGRCSTIGCAGRRALLRRLGEEEEEAPPPSEEIRPEPGGVLCCAACQGRLQPEEKVLP